jgi:hypothetical protein
VSILKFFHRQSLSVTVLCFTSLAGVVNCAQPDVRWVNRNQIFVLNERELAKRKYEALAGNSKAAFEVFLHYSLGLHDHKHGEPWLRLANKLGSPDAKSHLVQFRIAQPSEYARFKREKTLPKPGD